MTAVCSMGSRHKIFLGEYPFCDLPFAVWEGQHFTDFRQAKYYASLPEAQKDIDRRMDVQRQRYVKKISRNVEEQDRLQIKDIAVTEPFLDSKQ